MARKNDWCVVIDSYPGLLATDWPLYGDLNNVDVLLPNRRNFRTSVERYGNIIRISEATQFWSFFPNNNRFTGIPAGSVLTNRRGENGRRFIEKYETNKLDTVLEQCMHEHMLKQYWIVGHGYSKSGYTSYMVTATNNFHQDYEPLPEHPLVVVDCSNHGPVTDFVLDDVSNVYEWQRLDFYDHKGSLCYSGYVREIAGNTVKLADCLHDERNRNYHRMPNEPKQGMVGIEPHTNQLVLIDRYLKGEFNDYIKQVMTNHLVTSGYKLPKVHLR